MTFRYNASLGQADSSRVAFYNTLICSNWCVLARCHWCISIFIIVMHLVRKVRWEVYLKRSSIHQKIYPFHLRHQESISFPSLPSKNVWEIIISSEFWCSHFEPWVSNLAARWQVNSWFEKVPFPILQGRELITDKDHEQGYFSLHVNQHRSLETSTCYTRHVSVTINVFNCEVRMLHPRP